MDLAIISTYPPQICGIASYTHDLLEAVAAADPAARTAVLAEHGASPTEQPLVRPCFDGDTDYVAPLLREVTDLRPRVVHIEHEYGVFGVDERFDALLRGIRRLQIPVVVTLHTVHTALSFNLGCSWSQSRPGLDDIDIEKYQRQIGAAANVVVVHQEVPMRRVLIRQGVRPQDVYTIPHGTSTPPQLTSVTGEADTAAVTEPPLLVAFGYCEATKNHLVLIEAFADLLDTWPNSRLVIGAHIRYPVPETLAYRDRCERLVSELGISANVTFLREPVPEQNVGKLLAAADVACFVYDEDTRSSSGALHRAVGCGVPVVAARIPKFTEVGGISDELLVNPRSSQELTRLLRRVLADGKFRSHIRERSHLFAQATSWNVVAAQHLAIYRRLAQVDDSEQSTAPQESCLVP